MEFNTHSGVFNAPNREEERLTPQDNPFASKTRFRSTLSVTRVDIICICLLIAEVVLLIIFADSFFYGLVMPFIILLLDISEFVVVFFVFVAAGSAGLRKVFHSRRGRR